MKVMNNITLLRSGVSQVAAVLTTLTSAGVVIPLNTSSVIMVKSSVAPIAVAGSNLLYENESFNL